MHAPPGKTPLARLSLLFFLQPLSSALWMLPFGNILASHHLGTLVPLVFAFPPIAALFSPILAGILADHKIQSLKLLRYLLLGSSTLMFLASLAVAHTKVPLLLALMFTHAVIVAPTSILSTALALSHSTNPARHFPFFRIWSTVSWISAGYLISFGIASDFSPRSMTAASFCELALALYTFALPPAPTPNLSFEKRDWKEILGIKAIFNFPESMTSNLFLMFGFTMCFSAAFYPYVPQLFSSSGSAKPSAWMTIAQWSEILFIGLLPFFLRRVKPQRLMIVGLACSGVRCLSFMGYAFRWGEGLAVLGLAMHGPITAFTFVSMQILMEKNLPKEVRNRAQAVISTVGSGIGPLMGLMLSGLIASSTILPGHHRAGSWAAFWGAFAILHALVAAFFHFKLRRIPLSQSA